MATPPEQTRLGEEIAGAPRLLLKLKKYALERFAIVGLLWAGIAAAAFGVPYATKLFLPAACGPLVDFKLAQYVDEKLLAILSLGLMVSVTFLSLFERMLTLSRSELDNLRVGRMRLWDEISSAATHLAFGTFILALTTKSSGLGWTVLAYVSFAYLTFNDGGSADILVMGEGQRQKEHHQ